MNALTFVMIIAAYLIGSISSAVLICRLWRLPDPRQHGSGNPGATNVLRLGGRLAAALVLLLDLLKGTIPVWSAYFLGIGPLFLGIIAIAACLGHIYPIFFRFQGGKGVATALGAMLPMGLDLAGMLIASWLLVLAITGYSSLAALVAAVLSPLFTYWIKPAYTLPVAMLSCLIIWRHQGNIIRLLSGQESKIWQRKKPDPTSRDSNRQR